MTSLRVHAVIIGWEDKNDRARAIAALLEPVVSKLTVVYSNAAETDLTGPGDWLRVPNADFFGRKFYRAIEAFDGDIFLLVHADTDYADWPALVRRCTHCFTALPQLGVWSPDFTYTPYPTIDVALLPLPLEGLVTVAQTDGIVFALSAPVVDRMAQLEEKGNNLGWGIDRAAAACARTTGRLVVRDQTLLVRHDISRGYMGEAAGEQMWAYLAQLTLAERDMLLMSQSHFRAQRHDRTSRYQRLRRFLGRKDTPLFGVAVDRVRGQVPMPCVSSGCQPLPPHPSLSWRLPRTPLSMTVI